MHMIKRQIGVFLARQDNAGPHYRQGTEAVERGSFNGVTVQKDSKQKSINPQKFYEALTDSMSTRMVTENETSLFDQINFLPSAWPSPLPLFYGEDDTRELCDLFNVGFSGVQQEYRDFKEHQEIPVKQGLLKLQQAVKSYSKIATTDTTENRQHVSTDVYFFGGSSSGPVGSNKIC